jgi:hypothetical protein
MKETKQCPFCGETIEASTLVCPYCGEDLPKPAPAPKPEPEPETKPEPKPEPKLEPIPIAPPKEQARKKEKTSNTAQGTTAKRQGSGKGLFVAGCIALAALVAGLLWWLLPFGGGGGVGYDVDYLPFRETTTSNWGLIAPDGEVLFTEEFKEQPTAAVNGRFLVKNEAGLWDIYTAEKKPKRIAGDFLQAGMFYEKVAPVVEKGKPIQLIDVDGKVVTTLSKIDGKVVSECYNFQNGLAVVKAGGYYGAIDTKGEMVIEPRYNSLEQSSCGKFLAIDKRYNSLTGRDFTYTILDSKGKELGEVKADKFSDFSLVTTSYRTMDKIVDDLLVPMVNHDGQTVMGLATLDGEWQVEPSGKTYVIPMARAGNFTFYNTDGTGGLMDSRGEVLIRAKYEQVFFVSDDLLMVKTEGDDGYTLVNTKGEELSKETYQSSLSSFDGKHIFVQVGDNDWTVINTKGEEQKLKTSVSYVDFVSADYTIESDYVDVDDVVASLKITKDGFLGLTTAMTGPDVVKAVNSRRDATGLNDDARSYGGSKEMSSWVNYNTHIAGSLGVNTTGLINATRSGRGWYGTTRYEWTNNPVKGYGFFYTTDLSEKLKGNMQQLATKLLAAVKQTGNVVKEGQNAVVVETGAGNYYYAYWGGQHLRLYYGQFDPASVDVNIYNNVIESDKKRVTAPALMRQKKSSPAVTYDDDDYDYGELESPPADDL